MGLLELCCSFDPLVIGDISNPVEARGAGVDGDKDGESITMTSFLGVLGVLGVLGIVCGGLEGGGGSFARDLGTG